MFKVKVKSIERQIINVYSRVLLSGSKKLWPFQTQIFDTVKINMNIYEADLIVT